MNNTWSLLIKAYSEILKGNALTLVGKIFGVLYKNTNWIELVHSLTRDERIRGLDILLSLVNNKRIFDSLPKETSNEIIQLINLLSSSLAVLMKKMF